MCDEAAEQSSRPSPEEMEQHMRLSCLIEAGQLAKRDCFRFQLFSYAGNDVIDVAKRFLDFVKDGA